MVLLAHSSIDSGAWRFAGAVVAGGRLTSASGLARFLWRIVPEGVEARTPTPSWEKGLGVDEAAGEAGFMLILACLVSGSSAFDSVVDGSAGGLFADVDAAESLFSGFG